MVEIPVEIATFQNHQFRSLVRDLDHLVTTTVTTPISTEVILSVIKLLVTTTRVTAILVGPNGREDAFLMHCRVLRSY